MTTFRIKKIFFAVIFGLLLFSYASANEAADPVSRDDSMYKYNALENQVTFLGVANEEDNTLEKEPAGDEQSFDDTAKKLEDITQKQIISTEKTDDAIENINNTDKITTFIVGNDLGALKFQLVQIKDQQALLEALALNPEYSIYLVQINDQFKSLKEKQKKVENLILEKENEFSLLGWFVKIL